MYLLKFDSHRSDILVIPVITNLPMYAYSCAPTRYLLCMLSNTLDHVDIIMFGFDAFLFDFFYFFIFNLKKSVLSTVSDKNT